MYRAEFNFKGIKKDKKKAEVLRKPKFIGDFSLDEHRNFHSDKRNLRYFDETILQKDDPCFNLNKNVDNAIKKNELETKNEKLDRMLQWILLNKFKFLSDVTKTSGFTSLSTDFICFRGLLTELLCTPYDYKDGWIIHATKFAGTIYLLAIETPEKARQRLSETEELKRMSSWGYKFEQFMANEDTNKAVNENEEYCCILRSRMDQHSFVYGAEVDCASKQQYEFPHDSLSAFVELKTCKIIATPRDRDNFNRFRLRKWWAQSYLVGIPRIICGFRDMEGVVRELVPYKVEEIPDIAEKEWSKEVMFNFLNDFLSWMKTVVINDDPNHVYKFHRLPKVDRITCEPLGFSLRENFLPDFYTKEIFK